MIQTDGLVTKVEFGKDEKASIAVSAKKGTLTLQMLANEKNIGDKIESIDTHDLPKIDIEFFNIQSVDVFIAALQCIKSNYVPPPHNEHELAKAC